MLYKLQEETKTNYKHSVGEDRFRIKEKWKNKKLLTSDSKQ